ncbi:phage major capsid protein [Streptomyces prunicolor]|uniref:phage major capsid protein n=1 Tax=Streptomyces prunicolor TaxID=67348 RepID=UPI000998530A|nr:phage major capsid protein [Streptomyces prunicolor]
MAASISNWIPIEWSSTAIQRVQSRSAVEGYARGENMGSDTMRVLRSGGLTVGVGGTYVSDSSSNDYILLDSQPFTGQFIVAEDDLADADSVINTINVKATDWAANYADVFDNACLAVTGAGDGSSGTPFNSVYKTIRTNGSGVTSAYSADANYLAWNGTASAAYDKFSGTLGLVETGQFWDMSNSLVIAHPTFRASFRQTKDDNNMPVFVQGLAGTPDTLFGVPVAWSLGAKTSPTVSAAPAGNPILIFCGNTDLLVRGDRLSPRALIDTARAHDSTDQTALKLKVRKAFGVAHPNGFSVLEKTA